MNDDFPEELKNDIPDPTYIHMSWDDDNQLNFSFGGMDFYGFKGRLYDFVDDLRLGVEFAPVDEEE